MAASRIEIEMTVQVNVGGRRIRAFLEAGVRKAVHHDVIARPDQSLDDAVTGGPPGWIKTV